MFYIVLIFALLLEVLGTSVLKYSNGFEKPIFGVSAYALYGLSIYLFSLALTRINLAIADTIWQGTGIVRITLVSAFFFHEAISWKQMVFILITIVGVVGIGVVK